MMRTQESDISASDLDFLCCLIRDRSAIVLEPSKAYLLKARLEPYVKTKGIGSIAALVKMLQSPLHAKALGDEVVDIMTTNETSFFRDFHPFETLRNAVIPQLINKRASTRTLSIWCAAASSGQEPYSVAMLLREYFPELQNWKVNYIATDISSTMIARCREGLYSQLEVNRGLPANYLVKYFKQEGGCWRINADIRQMLDFRQLNLISTWPPLPRLDLVMIRNVLIYFDSQVKRRILDEILKSMAPDAVLFLGTAETTLNIHDKFKRVPQGSTSYYVVGGRDEHRS